MQELVPGLLAAKHSGCPQLGRKAKTLGGADVQGQAIKADDNVSVLGVGKRGDPMAETYLAKLRYEGRTRTRWQTSKA